MYDKEIFEDQPPKYDTPTLKHRMMSHMGLVPQPSKTFMTTTESDRKQTPVKEDLFTDDYDPRYDSVLLPDVPPRRRNKTRRNKDSKDKNLNSSMADIAAKFAKSSGISKATMTIRAIRKWKAMRDTITAKLRKASRGIGVGAFMTKFFAADKNNDGSVDREEFMMMCKKTVPSLTKEEMEHLADSADDDGTGHIGMNEFTEFLKRDLNISTKGIHRVLITRKQPKTLIETSRILRQNPIRLAQKKMKELDPKGYSYQMCTTEAVRTAIKRRNIHDAGTQRRDFRTWIHSNSSSINSEAP